MKKIVLISLLLMVSLVGFAQKGRHALGVDFTGKNYEEAQSVLLGVKYQYNISDYIRIEPFLQGKISGDGGGYEFITAVNAHAFFLSPRRFRPYAYLGLGYSVASFDNGYDEPDESEIYFQTGLGIDWRFSYRWSWQLELGANASWGVNVSTGITYNF